MNIEDVAKLPAFSIKDYEYQYGEKYYESSETILLALQSIVDYNCLSEELRIVRDGLLQQKKKMNGDVLSCVGMTRPKDLCGLESDKYNLSQFEIFWMLLVLMFGEFGTSPRNGYINNEQIDDAILFVNWLIDTEDNAEE